MLIQTLLHGLKMDPLVSLHLYAPVCALINLCVIPFTEGLEPFSVVWGSIAGSYSSAMSAVSSSTVSAVVDTAIGATSGEAIVAIGEEVAQAVVPHITPFLLITNALLAFLLNIAAVYLVGVGSGLVLTLAGVFKDVLLVTGSVVIWGGEVSLMQAGGEFLCRRRHLIRR